MKLKSLIFLLGFSVALDYGEEEEVSLSQQYMDDFGPLYQGYLELYGSHEPFFEALEEGFESAFEEMPFEPESDGEDYDENDSDFEQELERFRQEWSQFQEEFQDSEEDDMSPAFVDPFEGFRSYQSKDQDEDYDSVEDLKEYDDSRVPQSQPIFPIFILAAKAIAIAAKAAAAAKGIHY
jgi:hypothetical protein